jgi:serine protease Do
LHIHRHVRPSRLFFYLSLLVSLIIWPLGSLAQTESARSLFSDNKASILQIRIIDITSGSKSAIGSGFVIEIDGLIATNYHVVQLAASEPGQYRIEYSAADDSTGDLQLVDVDVVNDLALLQTQDTMPSPLPLAMVEPDMGSPLFALGNPLDLGLTVVPGTYNGVNQTSYHPRVHFTGSLNAGMSGGPTLSETGEVVGINVSTAGNQVSFLVPVKALHNLRAEHRARGQGVSDFTQRIGEQLKADQADKFSRLFALEWPTMSLGSAQVIAEIVPFAKCWGGSNSASEKAQFRSADRTCRSEDNIYLSGGFNTGVMEYQFFWLEADKLNPMQFYAYYERLFGDFAPGNKGSEEDLGEYRCDSQFLALAENRNSDNRKSKNIFCVRAYKDFPDLYDVLFLHGTVDASRAAFISHFTLAGVSQDNAKRFVQRFLGVAKWPS